MPGTTRSTAGLAMALMWVIAACASPTPPAAGAPAAGSAAASEPVATTAPPTVATSLPPYAPVIDPAAFVAGVTNAYFPLKPGTTVVLDGNRDDQPRHDEMTVTSETKTIMGVACIVVRDVATSNTALVEKTTDWYAQDKEGNVWYFGEDTAEYTNGQVTSTAGTWLAGVDGALPGLIMKSAPAVSDAYRQEYRPGIAEDYAKVLQTDARMTTPGGAFDKVVVTEDTDLLDATKNEHKSYAPGVGFVATDGLVNGHHEVRALTSILTAK
jgi:hypothetical protein